MFRPSRFNVFVPLRNGRRLAYNSLSGAFALWDADDGALYERLESSEAETPIGAALGAMVQGGFLVHAAVDELEVLGSAYRSQRFGKGSMLLTIAPTMACNFGCDYCFQGQGKPTAAMPPAVQDAVVAYVERRSGETRHLHVAWYGGEPLIRRDVVEALSDRLMALCDARGIRYDASIVTNGYLLTPDAARSLAARRVGTVQVTLDGAAADHDGRRALLSGKGTFERIASNLAAALPVAPLSYSIRVNIDHRNAAGITRLVDSLAEKGLGHRRNFGLYFAPVEALTTGCHAVTDVTMSKQGYGRLEAELCRYAYDRGLTGLPYPPRFRGTCGAVRPKGFVVLPTGLVHKCWDTVDDPAQAVGSIFDMDSAEESEGSRRWLEWDPLQNETCKNCRILPSCTGACAYKFLYADDTRGEAAVLPCPSWKYNLKERLVLRAEKTGAIGPEDYDPGAIRTDPQDLCADAHLGGVPLPAPMQRTEPATRPRRALPVLRSV